MVASRNVGYTCFLRLAERPLIQVNGFLFLILGIVRSCEKLNPPSNGAFIGVCNSEYNSVCRIKCNENYEVSGSAERKCIVTAAEIMDWSGQPFQCQGEVKTSTSICTSPSLLVYKCRQSVFLHLFISIEAGKNLFTLQDYHSF